jgi:hypothetical protein
MVTDQLNLYLSALPPGGHLGMGWPLGRRVVAKDLEAVVSRVPGVEYVQGLEMGAAGGGVAATELALGPLELPRLVALRVQEGDAEPLSSAFGGPGAPQTTPPALPAPVARATC